jgi:hypothetical protein
MKAEITKALAPLVRQAEDPRDRRTTGSGFSLELTGGMRLDAFPNSTPTGHVATEFWRLSRPGVPVPHFVVGTFGVERDEG